MIQEARGEESLGTFKSVSASESIFIGVVACSGLGHSPAFLTPLSLFAWQCFRKDSGTVINKFPFPISMSQGKQNDTSRTGTGIVGLRRYSSPLPPFSEPWIKIGLIKNRGPRWPSAWYQQTPEMQPHLRNYWGLKINSVTYPPQLWFYRISQLIVLFIVCPVLRDSVSSSGARKRLPTERDVVILRTRNNNKESP